MEGFVKRQSNIIEFSNAYDLFSVNTGNSVYVCTYTHSVSFLFVFTLLVISSAL